jgi:hypothetical protein
LAITSGRRRLRQGRLYEQTEKYSSEHYVRFLVVQRKSEHRSDVWLCQCLKTTAATRYQILKVIIASVHQ